VFDCGVVLHLKLGNPQGSTQDHTALYEPSFLGADPWSLWEGCWSTHEGPSGRSTMTWDQSLMTVKINTITRWVR